MNQLNTVPFPSNSLWDFSHQFLNIIFVKRKTHSSFSVKYTCFMSHLSDEKTKGIYIYHIYFEIATFLKTGVYCCNFKVYMIYICLLFSHQKGVDRKNNRGPFLQKERTIAAVKPFEGFV